nr:cytochrome P450 family 81 subfamily K polypeptide 1 [Ipomoea batatas]
MQHREYEFVGLMISFQLQAPYKLREESEEFKPDSFLGVNMEGNTDNFILSLALDSYHLETKYGPVLYLRFGCQSFLVISSPSGVEECLTKNDIVFASRPQIMAGDMFSFNYSSIVWAPYGQFWRLLRRFAAIELFSTINLQSSSIFHEEEVRILIRSLFRVSKSGSSVVDVKNWVSIFAYNTIMRLVSGERLVNEEDAGGTKGKEIIKELRKLFFPDIPFFNVCDFFPVLRWFDYKGIQKKMVLLQKERIKFSSGLLDEFQQKEIYSSEPSIQVKNRKKATPIIKTLLSLQKLEPEFYTDDIIKSFLLVMFIAGTETSFATIVCALTHLLAHPEVMHKLRSEIDSKVGQRRLVNESDLPTLPYLHCVVNETLRLNTPVPFLLPHWSSEDCVVGGYDIPKNTTLMINVCALHQDPKEWEEPEKFKPERFETMEGEKDGFGYKFVPFGLGRRACPGNNMGLRAISLALGAIIQVFDWENVGKDKMDAGSLEAVCTPRQDCIPLLSQL